MTPSFQSIQEPRVVYEGDGVLVVAKPSGMHCAPASEAGTLCAWAFRRYPALAAVVGRGSGEGGLLHRLDSATSGLVAFAADEASFSAMTGAAARGAFVKTYRALGLPSATGLQGSRPESIAPPGADAAAWVSCLRRADRARLAEMLAGASIESVFRPFGPGSARVACSLASGTPGAEGKAAGGGKAWTRDAYRSSVLSARAEGDGVLATIALTRGFRHQVRAHMAWLGLPLEGDALYGEGATPEGLRLQACRLSFPSPRGGGDVVVDLVG